MRLVGKLATNPYVKPLGEMFETTSGFGGKSELITESQVNQRQTPTMKGDSISKYNTRKKYWFEFAPKNITGRTTDRTKLGARPKILLRKTGNSIIATYDDSGIFPEQSLYFLFNKKTDSDFKFVLGLLNSQLMNVFFKAKCLTNKDSIAQVKKVDLDLLPIVGLNLKDSADKTRHDKLVLLVDKLLGLMPKLRAVTSEREKATLQNAITAANQEIFETPHVVSYQQPRRVSRVAFVAAGGHGTRHVAHAICHRGIGLRGSLTFFGRAIARALRRLAGSQGASLLLRAPAFLSAHAGGRQCGARPALHVHATLAGKHVASGTAGFDLLSAHGIQSRQIIATRTVSAH